MKLTSTEQNMQSHAADIELGLPRITESWATGSVPSDIDPEIIKKAGRSTRRRERGHIVDELNLNVCLCGSVVDSSMEGVAKCKRPSCETQWVSKFSKFGMG